MKKVREIFPLPKCLLPIISQINRCEGRILLPTAQWWLFLHFIPTAALGKYLTEAITIHYVERVTINSVLWFLDKEPFISWPLMSAAVSPCSGFSFVLCSLFPSHTNTTLFTKPQPGPFVRVHINTQCFQCILLPLWQICSLHLGDVEMTPLFRQAGWLKTSLPTTCLRCCWLTCWHPGGRSPNGCTAAIGSRQGHVRQLLLMVCAELLQRALPCSMAAQLLQMTVRHGLHHLLTNAFRVLSAQSR